MPKTRKTKARTRRHVSPDDHWQPRGISIYELAEILVRTKGFDLEAPDAGALRERLRAVIADNQFWQLLEAARKATNLSLRAKNFAQQRARKLL